MAYKETLAFEKRVASLLAEKWERHYSEMIGFVTGRMSLKIIRSNTRLLSGACGGIEDSAGVEALGVNAEW